uniref:Uncharacterized protein n=1 Tax=viral metagenome TaxID=1070528 RepID=A0A6C0J5J5_9ZZZZ
MSSNEIEDTIVTEIENTMVLSTDANILINNRNTIDIPDMTKKFMVPSKLSIWMLSGPRDNKVLQPAKDIIVRIFCGTELFILAEPYFQESNVIELDAYSGLVERNGRMKVEIINKHKESTEFRIITDYTSSYGGIIHQERNSSFDDIMDHIDRAGKCTKLTLTFNKQITSLSFLVTSCCLEGKWIESFKADIEEDNENNVYTFDFINDLSNYADYLKYLKLNITDNKEQPILMAYVTAWGYPHCL